MPGKVDHALKITHDITFERPKMFNVIMMNDDVTTMDFVISILVTIFKQSSADASKTMLEVHTKGRGIAGTYTYDIAATKKLQTDLKATEHGFPLTTVLEEV